MLEYIIRFPKSYGLYVSIWDIRYCLNFCTVVDCGYNLMIFSYFLSISNQNLILVNRQACLNSQLKRRLMQNFARKHSGEHQQIFNKYFIISLQYFCFISLRWQIILRNSFIKLGASFPRLEFGTLDHLLLLLFPQLLRFTNQTHHSSLILIRVPKELGPTYCRGFSRKRICS